MLLYTKALICVDPTSGEKIWRFDLDRLPEVSSILYTFDSIYASRNDDMILVKAWTEFFVLSSGTGEMIRALPELSISGFSCDLIEFEGDRYIFSSDVNGVTVSDSVDGSTVSHFPFERDTFGSRPSFTYCDDGILFFCSQSKESSNYSLSDYTKTVFALDTVSGNILWKWETQPEIDYGDSMCRIFEHMGRRILAYASANMIALIDTADGSTIDMQITDSDITAMIDSSETGALLGFTYDGESWSYGLKEDGIRNFIILPYLNTRVKYADLGKGGYWVLPPNSQTIIRYEFLDGDPSWRYFDADDAEKGIELRDYSLYLTQNDRVPIFGLKKYIGKEAMCVLRNSSDGDALSCVDIPRTMEDLETVECIFTGCISDDAYFLWTGYTSFELVRVDLNSGNTETVAAESAGTDLSDFSASGDGLYALLKESSGEGISYYAAALSADLQIKEKVLIGTFSGDEILEFCNIGDGRLMAYSPQRTYVIDLSRIKVFEAPQSVHTEVEGLISLGNHINGRVLWSDRHKAYIIDPDDVMITIIPEGKGNGAKIMSSSGVILSFFLSPDEEYLLTLEADSYLRRYSLSGEMLGSSYLRKNISDVSGVELQYRDDDKACLRLSNDLCVISCSDWELAEYVSGCIGYSSSENIYILLTYSDSRYRLGYFHKRGVSEMVEFANEILDGWDLPSDIKRRYGID